MKKEEETYQKKVEKEDQKWDDEAKAKGLEVDDIDKKEHDDKWKEEREKELKKLQRNRE